MIDIHSHILPGVDDGASSMKESLHMLSMARRQGITDVFATSHYSKAFPNRDPEKLRRLRDELMSRANRPVKGSGWEDKAQTANSNLDRTGDFLF